MSQQNYKNHIRFYPPHHFLFSPLVIALFVIAMVNAIRSTGNTSLWWVVTAGLGLVAWLSFMMRQHYALVLQNRLVRMEMRFRYYVLTGQRLEPLERQLTFKQLAALRFASDEELPALLQQALKERLSPKDIKRNIRNWQADDMRV